MNKTHIAYADFSWNPIIGCKPISDGCANCYAKTLHEKRTAARRAGANLPGQYMHEFDTAQLFEDRLRAPAARKNPATVFVCDMGDIFYHRVPDEWIVKVFEAMEKASWHRFLLLTKRAPRMSRFMRTMRPLANVWIGITVEAERYLPRLQFLNEIDPGWRRWMSVEPMLGPLDVPRRTRLDFVVCGCESGQGRRAMDIAWARAVRDRCGETGTPFMLKQADRDGRVVQLPTLDRRVHADLPGEAQ